MRCEDRTSGHRHLGAAVACRFAHATAAQTRLRLLLGLGIDQLHRRLDHRGSLPLQVRHRLLTVRCSTSGSTTAWASKTGLARHPLEPYDRVRNLAAWMASRPGHLPDRLTGLVVDWFAGFDDMPEALNDRRQRRADLDLCDGMSRARVRYSSCDRSRSTARLARPTSAGFSASEEGSCNRGQPASGLTDSRRAQVCTHPYLPRPQPDPRPHRRLSGAEYPPLGAALVGATERTGDGILT